MKRWSQFLLCLLLSASIWLIHNLSQEYAGVVSVSVLPESSLKGRASVARESVTVSARCSATGFKLIQLNHQQRDIRVKIHAEDLVSSGDDRYTVSAVEMAKYSSEIFGESVKLITFLNQSYTFSFAAENYKTVPIRAVFSATYKPQYMAAGPVVLHPDSVTVYGSEASLASLDAVLTKDLSFSDLSKNVNGAVRLIQAPGVRMSETEVAWSLDVVRYVELRSEVKIGARGVPLGTGFSVYPSTATAVFRCQFPARSNPAETCNFYIDYEEFQSSLTGRCVPHCDNMPAYVITWHLEPEVFDCVEREEAE